MLVGAVKTSVLHTEVECCAGEGSHSVLPSLGHLLSFVEEVWAEPLLSCPDHRCWGGSWMALVALMETPDHELIKMTFSVLYYPMV